MRIAIIGAGWFGCHIGSELLNDGHKIKVFEKQKNIFLGASGNNQNRLHLGYHYPRSYVTREQSRKCFDKFKKFYPKFSSKIKNNYYCISEKKENMIDFETYLQIIKSSKLSYEIIKTNKTDLKNISGIIKCPEEYITTSKAKSFFSKKFEDNIFFNCEIKNVKKKNNKFIINNFEFDFVVNTTWQQFMPSKKWDLSYELCVSLLYKCKIDKSIAITIMDGPFYTLYPWGNSIYNLYSVRHSRYKKTKKFGSIKNLINKVKKKDLSLIRSKMENEFVEYFPKFKNNFTFFKYIKTFRTLIDKKNHSRDYQMEFKNNIFNVLSGKIDHIFLAGEEIKKCLKNYS